MKNARYEFIFIHFHSYTSLKGGLARDKLECVGKGHDGVLFGPEVMITASGYRYNDGRPVTDQASDEADVVIGDDVWLGTRVTVLPGVRIGDGAIIGAHSVVRDDIPAMAVAVGSPARVVSDRRITASDGHT